MYSRAPRHCRVCGRAAAPQEASSAQPAAPQGAGGARPHWRSPLLCGSSALARRRAAQHGQLVQARGDKVAAAVAVVERRRRVRQLNNGLAVARAHGGQRRPRGSHAGAARHAKAREERVLGDGRPAAQCERRRNQTPTQEMTATHAMTSNPQRRGTPAARSLRARRLCTGARRTHTRCAQRDAAPDFFRVFRKKQSLPPNNMRTPLPRDQIELGACCCLLPECAICGAAIACRVSPAKLSNVAALDWFRPSLLAHPPPLPHTRAYPPPAQLTLAFFLPSKMPMKEFHVVGRKTPTEAVRVVRVARSARRVGRPLRRRRRCSPPLPASPAAAVPPARRAGAGAGHLPHAVVCAE